MRRQGTGKGRIKAFFQKLNRPPNWVAIIVYVTTLIVCPLALIAAAFGYGQGVFAGIAYTISGIIFLYTFWILTAKLVRGIKKLIKTADRYAFTRILKKNFEFRTLFFAFCSFVANVGYTVFLCVMAFVAGSEWYGALAAYYVLLTTTRGGVLAQNARDERNEKNDFVRLHLKKNGSYYYCGIMLIVLTLVLALAIVRMIVEGQSFRVPRWAIYAYAAVALYRLGIAIYNSRRAKRSDDMVVRAIRNINVASALVALLSLQTAWFAIFPPPFNVALSNAIVGGFICLIIVALGIYMLIFSRYVKKQLTAYENPHKQKISELEIGYNRAEYIEEYSETVSEYARIDVADEAESTTPEYLLFL